MGNRVWFVSKRARHGPQREGSTHGRRHAFLNRVFGPKKSFRAAAKGRIITSSEPVISALIRLEDDNFWGK